MATVVKMNTVQRSNLNLNLRCLIYWIADFFSEEVVVIDLLDTFLFGDKAELSLSMAS